MPIRHCIRTVSLEEFLRAIEKAEPESVEQESSNNAGSQFKQYKFPVAKGGNTANRNIARWGELPVLKTRPRADGMKHCNKRTKSCRRRERRTTWKNITSSYVSLSICQLQSTGEVYGSSYQAIGTFVSDFRPREPPYYFHSCYRDSY